MFVYFKYILHLCVTKHFLRHENNKNIWGGNENI